MTLGLIIEEHPIVLNSISRYACCGLLDVAYFHAQNGKLALELLSAQKVDVVLVDTRLPDLCVVDFCSTCKLLYPSTKILVFAGCSQKRTIEKVLAMGADGCVLHSCDNQTISNVLNELLKGNRYLANEVVDILEGRSPLNTPHAITKREIEVLKLIAEGFTNTQIAQKLFISENTVDSHRKNLLFKLDAKNTALLIRTAVDCGILTD